MNSLEIGMFLAKKRKEKGLTQAQLAEKLNVSNKTISKWETGKCMPDYGIMQPLCKELGITVAELMDGKEMEQNGTRQDDDRRFLDLLRRIQNLENQKVSLYGILLMVLGIALLALHLVLHFSVGVGASGMLDFFSGVFLGLSVGVMLTGVYITARGFAKQK